MHLVVYLWRLCERFYRIICRALAHLETVDCAPVLQKLHLEQNTCMLEEALLQRDNDELRVLEVFPDHYSNVLRV